MGFEIQPVSARLPIARDAIVSRPARPRADVPPSPAAISDAPTTPSAGASNAAPTPRSFPSEAQMQQLRLGAMITAVRRMIDKSATPNP